jgi:hypothetical protein
MTTTVKLKNSVTTTNAPSTLQQGEVAINITDKKVWVGNAATTPVQLIGGGASAFFTSLTSTGASNFAVSSGNVGIGNSSPAYKLDVTGVIRGTGNIISGDGSAFVFGPNTTAYIAGSSVSNSINLYTNSLERLRIDSGGNVSQLYGSYFLVNGSGFGWGDATTYMGGNSSTDIINFVTNSNERMRITSAGFVGIGNTGPGALLGVGNATDQVQAGITSAVSVLYLGSPNNVSGGQATLSYNRSNGTISLGQSTPGGALGNFLNIDVNGNFLVGTTSVPSGGFSGNGSISGDTLNLVGGIRSHAGVGGAFSSNSINFYWTGSGVDLYVDVTNRGAITTSSDYRVKKDIETQTTSALNRIQQIRPVTYTFQDYKPFSWKADGIAREGFIAHELAEVIPSAVAGEKDAPNQVQSLKLDALCSVMVKAIQEQQALIESLTTRLNALEGK